MVSAMAGSLSASGAILVAGIDTWSSTTAPAVTNTAAGITATATASTSSGAWSITDNGTDPGGVENFTVTNGRPSAEVTLTIVNGGTDDLNLAAFHLDVVAFRPNAPRTYALNVLAGSDITVGNVFTSPTTAITHLGGGLTGHDQHDDIDLDLSALADSTLSPGETAILQIAFSDGTGSGGGHHLFLDNVAVSGDFVTVPEPSSAILLSLSGLALLGRRRR